MLSVEARPKHVLDARQAPTSPPRSDSIPADNSSLLSVSLPSGATLKQEKSFRLSKISFFMFFIARKRNEERNKVLERSGKMQSRCEATDGSRSI